MARLSKPLSMRDLASRYLAQKRGLGYAFRFYDGRLTDFARRHDRTSPGGAITTNAACQWASAAGATPAYRAKLLSLIRNFARFCLAYDPRTQVPPAGLLGPSTARIRPHIYSPTQIRALVRNARRLPPVFSPLRPFTYQALVGLLAVTGLRRSEVLRLRLADFDPDAGTLRIARAKFAPERLLPLHPSTVKALQDYLKRRQRLLPLGDHLFVGHRGQAIPAGTLQQTFRLLTSKIPANGRRPQPRIHDLRHSFATRRIAIWSKQAAPLAHRLLLLSRYMGHRHFHDTWWYVSGDPQALHCASKRFDRFRHGRHQLER